MREDLTIVVHDDPRAWFKRVQEPNPSKKDKQAMRSWLKDRPEVWAQISDLIERVENKLLEDNPIVREAIGLRLLNMRDELGWEESSMLEKLMIEQVNLCWLRLYLVENTHANLRSGTHNDSRRRYRDRRLDGAQRRFVRASTALARIRKLLNQQGLLDRWRTTSFAGAED